MKSVITSQDIARARQAGVDVLHVESGAIVTPQASEDAQQWGIVLRFPEMDAWGKESSVAPARTTLTKPYLTDHKQGLTPMPVSPTPINLQAVHKAASMISGVPTGGNIPGAEADTGQEQALVHMVMAAVRTPLQAMVAPEKLDESSLEGVVRAVVQEVLASCHHALERDNAPFRCEGAIIPSTLTAASSAMPGSVILEEHMASASMPGHTRLHCQNTTFHWEFSAGERLVVEEGSIGLDTGTSLGEGMAHDFINPASLQLQCQDKTVCRIERKNTI